MTARTPLTPLTRLDDLARQVRTALESADLAGYAHLLDPAVTWGAPGGDDTCRSRADVLSWYRAGYDAGVRADVTETSVVGHCILVGMIVKNDEGENPRWQVLTTSGGRIVDIRGYDDRADALQACR